jgi:hypothetical protein
MKIKELISGDVKNMTLLELVEKIGNDKFEKLMQEAKNSAEVKAYAQLSNTSLQLRQQKQISNERY